MLLSHRLTFKTVQGFGFAGFEGKRYSEISEIESFFLVMKV